MANYEIVDHTADWAIHVQGRNLAELLLHAAIGMNNLMIGEETYPKLVKAMSHSTTTANTISRVLSLDAFDRETLLVDWLTELAYFAEMEQIVFPNIELTNVSATHLIAQIQGTPVSELVKHIKAVTYHNLEIIETDDGLEVTIVFDV